MAIEIEDLFEELKQGFRAKAKTILDELLGQLLDDSTMVDMAFDGRKRNQRLAVIFDRRINDNVFSYEYFDLILVVIDALAGGSGILKPLHQVRVIKWKGSEAGLLRLLNFFAKKTADAVKVYSYNSLSTRFH